MRFKTGEKVYCISMNRNLVVACMEGEYACCCIDISHDVPSSIQFGTFILSAHDLKEGWK